MAATIKTACMQGQGLLLLHSNNDYELYNVLIVLIMQCKPLLHLFDLWITKYRVRVGLVYPWLCITLINTCNIYSTAIINWFALD